MSGTAHRYGSLPALVLVTFLVLTLGSGTAWPAMAGGHGGGFSGGAHGGHGGGSSPRGGRGFGGRHDHVGGDRRLFVVPYYFPYYGYDPYDGDPYYPYDAFCDPYSPFYAPEDC